MTKRKIMLIDGSSLAFRAFFSILNIDRFKNKDGLHTNALFSFNRMLDNILTEFEPTHVLVAFDKSGPTFRTEQYSDYKGGRQKTPSEFTEQMPYFRVLLEAYGISHYEIAGYEADDVIGTLSYQAEAADEVIVISGDKDLIQLASDNTSVYITRKGVSDLEVYTPAVIQEKFGLTPEQIIDMKGLMGDTSDNYPGITRIGEKTALKLLHQFKTMEGLYENLDDLKPSKMKENIINDRDNAFMSKQLARILLEAPIEIKLEDVTYNGRDVTALGDFYRQMEFNVALKDLQGSLTDTTEATAAAEQLPAYDMKVLTEIRAEHLPERGVYYTEMLEENYHFGKVEAVVWSDIAQHKIYQTDVETAFESDLFKEWLLSEKVEKITFDSKRERVIASIHGAKLEGVAFDTLLATYIIDAHNAQELADIARIADLPAIVLYDEAVYGKGAKKAIPEDTEVFTQHLANKVITLAEARGPLEEKLTEVEMMELFATIEMPLARTLAIMEIQGITVNREILDVHNAELLEKLGKMETEIVDLAGQSFNLNSPKQLGEILFDVLKLPVIKKTKTGYSTAADVLDKLKGQHPIIEEILAYRQLAKLQGTYLAGLPRYIKEDGKIHTRFVQTLTQTGRLSSTDPNLQNIPIRMEEGRRIRQAFEASQEDWVLFGADYSQIELRVLAHISGDEHMIQAFKDGEDIHAATARRVFNLPTDEEVNSDYRRQAKAVNFGIVYGISDYGLSQNLNISRPEAKQFIERYFEQYPGIEQFMKTVVDQAKTDGYVSTLFNRRRYLPDIHSKNFNLRSFAERTAMNSPIQGTAADILKIAMVKLQEVLEKEELQARILLQVHDELILEAPQSELERLNEIVPQVMEHAVELTIPLKVDYSHGSNWYDVK